MSELGCTKQQPPGLKNEANMKVPSFLEWALEAGSKSESVLIDSYVKMPNFTAEIKNSRVKKQFGLYS